VLIAADNPGSFLDDTPTSTLIRQILAAVQQFDRSLTVAKLKGAKDRLRASGGRAEGRYAYVQQVPETVQRARLLRAQGMTLKAITRQLAAEGFKTSTGAAYHMTAVGRMLSGKTR
jgi:DNA invertase Pin-like site-specific DNA recombinase